MEAVAFILQNAERFLLTALCLVPVGFALSFMERRLIATVQARVGPNRMGPAGVFQGLGDMFKLLQKSTRLEFRFWLGGVAWVFATVLILPLSGSQHRV